MTTPGMARSRPATAGVVLTGGLSSRMGTNKALIAIDGQPLAARVMEVLIGAGCAPVWFQGGDPSELAALTQARSGRGPIRADLWPREGPVGAIASALALARSTAPSAVGVLIAACDLIDLNTQTVRTVVDAGRVGSVAVATDNVDMIDGDPADVDAVDVDAVDVAPVDVAEQIGRPHRRRRHLLSWWPTGLADTVASLLASGTTSYRGLLAELDQLPSGPVAVVDVAVASTSLRNANLPSDLPPTG